MAVSAHPDNSCARPDTAPVAASGVPVIELRSRGVVLGGSHLYEGERLVTGWHTHDLHQIEYAVGGLVEIDTATTRYLVSPHQAAWIPSGLEHQATLNTATRTIAVLLEPGLVGAVGDRARVLAVSPLLREMLLFSLRWPIGRPASDGVADDFFRTLGHLVAEALDHEAPLSLPVPTDPVVRRATTVIQEQLAVVEAAAVSRAVGVSERTLRRRFRADLGIDWRTYLARSRLLRAMALLADPNRSVLAIAVEVGFENPSAFARAFSRHTGESPSAYRRRILTG